MMIKTIKPYGGVNELSIKFKYEQGGKYYAVDKVANRYEVERAVYEALDRPIWKRRFRDE